MLPKAEEYGIRASPGAQGPSVNGRPATDPAQQRVNPDVARAAATEKARKLEKALEAMSNEEGPVVDALRAELKKAQSAVAVPTLDVQIEQCQSFIWRSQRRLAELDKQRAAEEELLTKARSRLERLRLEAEQSRATSAKPQTGHPHTNRWFRRSAEIAADGGRTPIEIESSGNSAGPGVPTEAVRRRGHWHKPESSSTSTTKPIWRWCEEREEHGESWPSTWGLRGVRVGEASHPGPSTGQRNRRHHSRSRNVAADELLVRPIEGRDVIPRMASKNEPGSNRFAALADAETVPVGTQELEEVRVPETIIDALAEDLERPSRRLVLVGGGHQTDGRRGHSDHATSRSTIAHVGG